MPQETFDPVVTSEEPLEKRKVIIELRPTRVLAAAATSGPYSNRPRYGRPKAFDPSELLPGIDIDPTFAPTTVPAADNALLKGEKPEFNTRGAAGVASGFNFVVRAEVDDERAEELAARPEVVGVFADLVIGPCGGKKHPKTSFFNCSRNLGTHADVERLLCVPKMKSRGLDGSDVLVAVVGSGINLDYLNAQGKSPNFDRRRSWLATSFTTKIPGLSLVPGSMPITYGTMCAFDVCIAAPRCTLLDIALASLGNEASLSAFLSDALQAYEHLLNIMMTPRRPGEPSSLVVSNSWSVSSTYGDFPVGNSGNYTDNLNHPFNRLVTALEFAGADILFAAGNCGPNCPSGDCSFTTDTIVGANSHPGVLTVAGVDISRTRLGYSSIGPGRLTSQKPDICGYTQFEGSKVFTVDDGTSAACAVVAGVVAAFRTRWQYDPENAETHPAAIRSLITANARDLGLSGFDFQHGYGVVRGCPLADMFILAVADSLGVGTPKFPKPDDRIPPGGKQPGRASTLPAELVKILIRRAREASQDDFDEDDALIRDMSAIVDAYFAGSLQTLQSVTAPAPTPEGLWLQGLRVVESSDSNSPARPLLPPLCPAFLLREADRFSCSGRHRLAAPSRLGLRSR